MRDVTEGDCIMKRGLLTGKKGAMIAILRKAKKETSEMQIRTCFCFDVRRFPVVFLNMGMLLLEMDRVLCKLVGGCRGQ
jgi:hypothetical protein